MSARQDESHGETPAAMPHGGRRDGGTAGRWDKDFTLCFGGSVMLTVDKNGRVLGRGDAAAFSSTPPHRGENRSGEPAQVVIVSARFPH